MCMSSLCLAAAMAAAVPALLAAAQLLKRQDLRPQVLHQQVEAPGQMKTRAGGASASRVGRVLGPTDRTKTCSSVSGAHLFCNLRMAIDQDIQMLSAIEHSKRSDG